MFYPFLISPSMVLSSSYASQAIVPKLSTLLIDIIIFLNSSWLFQLKVCVGKSHIHTWSESSDQFPYTRFTFFCKLESAMDLMFSPESMLYWHLFIFIKINSDFIHLFNKIFRNLMWFN